MKISTIFAPIKKCFTKFQHSETSQSSVKMADGTINGLELLGEQNRVFIRPKNQVEPLQTEFNSTKDMYAYAKGRCVDALKSKTPYEHTVLVDTKENKVLAEYVGDENNCKIDNFDMLVKNPDYTILVHGHPNSYPLSGADVSLLMRYNVNQVMAVNEKGEFSLVAKRLERPTEKVINNTKDNYLKELSYIGEDFYGHTDSELYKVMCHENLKHNADNMGLRYLTNYFYLKK